MDTKHTHGCCADKACTQKTCMELPAGKTCGDCHNFKHCQAFYAHTQTDTYCDFFPRRFAERVAQSTGDEREQWLPLAGELRARILHKHQFGGTVLLSLEDVLAISCELKRAEES